MRHPGGPYPVSGRSLMNVPVSKQQRRVDLLARADDPELGKHVQLAVAKRPAEGLFDIRRDRACLTDLAADPKHAGVKQQFAWQLEDYLRRTGDAPVLDGGEVWETYKRYSPIRQFPPPAKRP